MKDSLDQLFRARFQGHEVPVDPGVWTAIQGQLAATAASGDGLNDLLRDRFNEHEVDVDPSVWEGISSQLGHGAAAGTTVGGTAWGWMAAAVGTVLVAAGAWLWTAQDQEPAQPSVQVAEVNAPVVEEATTGVPALEQARSAEDQGLVNRDAQQPARIDRSGATPGPERAQGPSVVTAPAPDKDAVQPKAARPGQPPTAVSSPEVPVPASPGTDRVERIIQELATQAREEAAKPETVPAPVEVVELAVEPVEEEVLSAPVETPKLFMPNVFTPNGDGVNDTYQVIGEGFERILVKVFAMKNNQLVFSTNTGEAWTGSNCDEGMYLVAVEALTSDGRAVTEGKVVWLNRTPMN